MKITIGKNPKIEVDAISIITKNNKIKIYMAYNKALYKDLQIYLWDKEVEIFYKGKVLETIENHNDQSIVLVF